MITTTLAQAAVPTSRVMPWRPLLGFAAAMAVVLALSRQSGQPTDVFVLIAAAGMASLAVGALHDPAAGLLATAPVSTMQRRGLRLALVMLPVLVLWWGLTLLAGPSADLRGPGPLLALVASGVAVAVWAPADRGALIGACVPLAIVALDQLQPWGGVAPEVVVWWRTESWSVVSVALVVLFAGRRR